MIDEVKKLVEQVKVGETDALKAYIEIKKLSDYCSEVLKEILDDALSVRESYPEKVLKMNGCEVEVRGTASQYKYDHIPEHGTYKSRLKAIEDNAKQALKLALKGQELVIDGEIITPAKVVGGKTNLFVKILKDEKQD